MQLYRTCYGSGWDLPPARSHLWHGADDSMTTPDDMKAWLGAHLREVRIVPGIGRFLGYSHWTEIMQWVAGETEDARGPD